MQQIFELTFLEDPSTGNKKTHITTLLCLKSPVPWCVPSKDAQRQISKLVAHLITDITRSLAFIGA